MKKPTTQKPTKKPTKKPAPRKLPPAPAYVTSPAIEELFAELATKPDDGATLVLADALAELGDVRAELAQVQRALAKATKLDRASLATREAALLHALRGRLLGKYAPHPEIAIETRLGFARELVITNQAPSDITTILMQALPSPDARLLESLQLASDDEQALDLGDVFDELAGKVAVPPSLRRIKLGNAFERDTNDRIASELGYDDYYRPGAENLKPLLTLFPRLTELTLDLGLVPVELPILATKNLEVFTWITPCLTTDELAPLTRAILPSLRRFELWIGGTTELEEDGDGLDEPFSMKHLDPVFAMLDRCTKLAELAIGHVPRLGKLLAVLEAHPLVKRLTTLQLSHLEIDDAGELIDFARAVPDLQLVLDGVKAGQLTRDTLERRFGKRLRADWATEPPRFRYVAGQE